MKRVGLGIVLLFLGATAWGETKDLTCTIKWDAEITPLKTSASGDAYYWENDSLVVLLKRHAEDPNRFQVVMIEDLPPSEKQALMALANSQTVGAELGAALKKAVSKRARLVYAAFYQNLFLLEESLQGHDFALSCLKGEEPKTAAVVSGTRK